MGSVPRDAPAFEVRENKDGKSELEDGVLTLGVPKKPEAQPKKIATATSKS